MTTPPAQLNEYDHVGEPARVPLERLGWTYTPRETLQSLKASAAAALLLGQVRVIGKGAIDSENASEGINETGIGSYSQL